MGRVTNDNGWQSVWQSLSANSHIYSFQSWSPLSACSLKHGSYFHMSGYLGLYSGYCQWSLVEPMDSIMFLRRVLIFYFGRHWLWTQTPSPTSPGGRNWNLWSVLLILAELLGIYVMQQSGIKVHSRYFKNSKQFNMLRGQCVCVLERTRRTCSLEKGKGRVLY